MTRPLSPYHAPGFYEAALSKGRHRDIVGGRWDETGRLQMAILRREGLLPRHKLLDIGCGSLRLGVRAVPFLDPGHYWGTDLSAALMRRGHEAELADKDRLPATHLIEDGDFRFPGIPDTIDHAIAFAVFTHLPADQLALALGRVRDRFPSLGWMLFTVFLGPPDSASLRQPDGVVTHPDRAPWHLPEAQVGQIARAARFDLVRLADRLPRGQVMFRATPA